MSNEYGTAQFYRNDAWSREGLKEHWLLQPKLAGNEDSTGDFESWSGAEGGCTDCPVDWTCDCTTGGGDINPETSKVYIGSTSAKLDSGAIFSSALLKFRDFLANKVYQISFWYKGEEGTEDFYFLAGRLDVVETYDWTSDTWTAPLSLYAITNASTTWTKATLYLTVGPVDKLAASLYGLGWISAGTDGTAYYLDDFQIREVETGIVGEMGNVLSVPVTSDPEWGNSEELLGRVGTGPAGNMGTKFDGDGAYLSRADDDSFDFVGNDQGSNFSVGCRGVITDSVAVTEKPIIGKLNGTGNQESWVLTRYSDDLYFYQSDDGIPGNRTNLSKLAVFTVGAVTDFVATYTYVDATHSEANLYANNTTVSSSAELNGPLLNTTASLTVGHCEGASFAGYWADDIGEVTIWEGALSAIQANKYINPYFPGNNHGDGFYVDTCTQATSWANCSTQKCRDGTPNACQAEGTGAMALFGQYTELVDDNSFETFTGDDSNPNFTHWAELETAGDGTSAITAYRADIIHGDVAARMVLTGTTSNARLDSACMTVSSATDYYAYVKMKKLSGTANISVTVREFSDGACSSFVQQDVLSTGDKAGVWTEYGVGFTTHASTNSAFFRILSSNSASDVLMDTVSVKAAPYRTPWIHKLADAETQYSYRDYRLHNPLSDYSEELDEYMYESGFCASAWVYTDWAGNDGAHHFILEVLGTAGNNNRWYVRKRNDGQVQFVIYDSAAGLRYILAAATSTTWAANDWKYVEVCSNNTDNVIEGHWYNVANSTWYVLGGATGAGTGIQDGQDSQLLVGHDSAASFVDGYISVIHIVPYNAIWPNEGFNSGRPPVNGRLY